MHRLLSLAVLTVAIGAPLAAAAQSSPAPTHVAKPAAKPKPKPANSPATKVQSGHTGAPNDSGSSPLGSAQSSPKP